MREFSIPLPGALGVLEQNGILALCESLDSLRVHGVHSSRIDELNGVADSASALQNKDEVEMYGLCPDDWNWSWGSRFSWGSETIEVRSFHSYPGLLPPETRLAIEEGKEWSFSWDHSQVNRIFGYYCHHVVECNSDRVLVIRLGVDSNHYGNDRPLLIAVKTFVPGPWIDLLKKVVKQS